GADLRARAPSLSAALPEQVSQEKFVSKLLPLLRRFLARRVLPEEDLDDAIQESALAILQAVPRFRGEATKSTFALAIAWRTLLANRRALARRRKAAAQMSDPERVLLENSLPLVQSSGPPSDPHEACIRRMWKDKILSYLESLPEQQAHAFVLRHLANCSISEMARLSIAPVPTVRSRLRAARQRLTATAL